MRWGGKAWQHARVRFQGVSRRWCEQHVMITDSIKARLVEQLGPVGRPAYSHCMVLVRQRHTSARLKPGSAGIERMRVPLR